MTKKLDLFSQEKHLILRYLYDLFCIENFFRYAPTPIQIDATRFISYSNL